MMCVHPIRRAATLTAQALPIPIGILTVTLIVTLIVGVDAIAAVPPPVGPPASPTGGDADATAFVGATVHPVVRPRLHRAALVVRGGKVEALGEELEPPRGARVVDLSGKHVIPGLVVVEAAQVGVDRPEGSFADSLDPYALSLRLALAAGITTVNLVGSSSGGFFGSDGALPTGTPSAVIKLTHGDLRSMLLREPGANYLALPSRSIEVSAFRTRQQLRKARDHLRAVAEAAAKKASPPALPGDLAPFVAILENKVPTVVSARSTAEVAAALALQAEFPFAMVIARPDEALGMARDLRERGIPVLLRARGRDMDFDLVTPVLDPDGLVPVRIPAAFHEAGVRVALLPYRRGVSLEGIAGRDLTAYLAEAAFAVRGGLDEDSALGAVTLEPARVLRLDDRVGSLEPGKDADFVVLDRPPLDYRSTVERVYIDGKLVYDRDSPPSFRPLFRRPEGFAPTAEGRSGRGGDAGDGRRRGRDAREGPGLSTGRVR